MLQGTPCRNRMQETREDPVSASRHNFEWSRTSLRKRDIRELRWNLPILEIQYRKMFKTRVFFIMMVLRAATWRSMSHGVSRGRCCETCQAEIDSVLNTIIRAKWNRESGCGDFKEEKFEVRRWDFWKRLAAGRSRSLVPGWCLALWSQLWTVGAGVLTIQRRINILSLVAY